MNEDYKSMESQEMIALDAEEFLLVQTETAFDRLTKYYNELRKDIVDNKRFKEGSWTPWTNYCYKIVRSCLRVVQKNNKLLLQLNKRMFKTKEIEQFIRTYEELYDYKNTGNEQAHRKKIREQIGD